MLLAQASAPRGAAAIGEYRFGMTRAQVAAVKSCAPYRQVASTGGLECSNFMLGTKRLPISFIFTGDALTRVQLWFYDGTYTKQAHEATAEMLAFLSRYGTVRSSEPKGPLTPDAILSKLRAMARGAQPGQAVRVQVLTTGTGKPPFVHGSATVARSGFYVFAFLSESPGTQPRR